MATTLTVKELKKACEKHKYLLCRRYDNELVGINAKIAPLALKLNPPPDYHHTKFVSYQPCDFMTYITYKWGFQ